MSKTFVTVYGNQVEGCLVTWSHDPTTNSALVAKFDCPFYSTTIQGQASGAESLNDEILSSAALTMDSFYIAWGIENNESNATVSYDSFSVKTLVTLTAGTPDTLACGLPVLANHDPSNLDSSSILTAGTGDWTASVTLSAANFCVETHNILQWDAATTNQAITRFQFELTRPMTAADAASFTIGYSTYNTQMYMGYNDATGVAFAGAIYYDGYTSASNTAVNFDNFNNESVTIEDAAVSGFTATTTASIIIASAALFAF